MSTTNMMGRNWDLSRLRRAISSRKQEGWSDERSAGGARSCGGADELDFGLVAAAHVVSCTVGHRTTDGVLDRGEELRFFHPRNHLICDEKSFGFVASNVGATRWTRWRSRYTGVWPF